jgi:hypothetical protein
MAIMDLIRQVGGEDRRRLFPGCIRASSSAKRDFAIVRRLFTNIASFAEPILLFVIAARRKPEVITALSRKAFVA